MLQDRLKTVKRPETEERIQAMFSSVAKRYDLANSLMSFGLHYGWKRKMVEAADVAPGDKALDVCAGTNDVAIMLAKAVGPEGHVTAVDFNQAMQAVGEHKVDQLGLSDRVTSIIGDAEALPLEDARFDVTTIAVATRHLRVDRAFAEMYRVLRPGGRSVCVEFFQPPNPVFRALYNFYSYTVMPRVATWATRDKTGVYYYLPDSIRVFHTPETFKSIMEEVGYRNVTYFPLCQGIVYVHRGEK